MCVLWCFTRETSKWKISYSAYISTASLCECFYVDWRLSFVWKTCHIHCTHRLSLHGGFSYDYCKMTPRRRLSTSFTFKGFLFGINFLMLNKIGLLPVGFSTLSTLIDFSLWMSFLMFIQFSKHSECSSTFIVFKGIFPIMDPPMPLKTWLRVQ